VITSRPLARAARLELGRPAGFGQLVAFCLVGASGYAVNLAVFTALLALAADYRLAACGAFLVAVANNYTWNRTWTFDGRGKAVGRQATRFFAVSLIALGVSLALLALFVAAGLGEVVAQAAAIVLATPVSFLGNKLWSFR
jgi:putative flippase GtrA